MIVFHFYFFHLEWRTQLQPIVVVSEEDSGLVEAEAIEEIEVVAEDAVGVAAIEVGVAEEVAERKRRNGFRSPNWDVLSRTERSSLLRRSTSSLFPLK
jgi:hypothetical protein